MHTPLLARMPLLRILAPFAAGILLAEAMSADALWPAAAVLVVGIVAYTAMSFKGRTPAGAIAMRGRYIVPLAAIALAAGWACTVAHRPLRVDLADINGQPVSGRIEDIRYRDFSMSMVVTLHADGVVPQAFPVSISTRGCDYTLKAGDLIAFLADIAPIANNGNPDEIDYQKIMERRGILYTQHVSVSRLRCYGHEPTLLNRMANVRSRLQEGVFNSDLPVGAQKMLVAIILGNGNFVDQDTRYEFSCAGISHILALSGLHVGIVAGLIWLLLMPLDMLGAKKLRLVITLLALFGFDMLTGLSSSVMRASIMVAFVFVSYILYRKSMPLNALLGAALFILLFAPQSLFSAGFQLSFITVAALLVYAPATAAFKMRSRFVSRLAAMAVTSLISTMATIVLTAYYFHTMSFVSVLTNLFVLPVMPAIMALGALLVLLLPCGFAVPWLVKAFGWGQRYIDFVASHAAMLPLSHTEGVMVSAWEVAAFYLIVFFLTMSMRRRTFRWANLALLVLAVAIIGDSAAEFKRPKSGLVVLNDYQSTPVLFYCGDSAFVWFPDAIDSVDMKAFSRRYAGFLSHNRIKSLTAVGNDHWPVRLCGGFVSAPYAYAHSQSFMAAGAGHWKTAANTRNLRPDVILVTKRYHSTVQLLNNLYHPGLFVLSGDIYADTEEQLRKECDSLRISYTSLRRSGAYMLCGD